MSQWEYNPSTGKSEEVGLAPGQSSGNVGGTYTVRPEDVPEKAVYSRGAKPGESTSVPVRITERDRYGRVIAVRDIGYGAPPQDLSDWPSGWPPPQAAPTAPTQAQELEQFQQEFRREAQNVARPPFNLAEIRRQQQVRDWRRNTPPIVAASPSVSYEPRKTKPLVINDTKYGRMISSEAYDLELHKQERVVSSLKESAPKGMKLSGVSIKSRKLGEKGAEYIRGLGFQIPYVSESFARVSEFAGMAFPAAETTVRTIFTQPAKMPIMAVTGAAVVAGTTADQITRNPLQFVSDILISRGVFKGAGKIAGKAGAERVKVGTVQGEDVTLWAGAQAGGNPLIGTTKFKSNRFALRSYASTVEEMSETGLQPVKVVTPGNVVLGTPKASQLPNIDIGRTEITTGASRKILTKLDVMEKYGYNSPREIAKATLGGQLLGKVEHTKSKYGGSLQTETKTTGAAGIAAAKRFFKKSVGDIEQIYGSFAAYKQVNPQYRAGGAKAMLSLPSDVDVQLKTPKAISDTASTKAAEKFTKELLSATKKAGEKHGIDPSNPLLIISKKEGAPSHAFDIHAGAIQQEGQIAPEGIFGYKYAQKPLKVEGLPIMRASEQTMRKIGSSLTLQSFTKEQLKKYGLYGAFKEMYGERDVYKGFFPALHRTKDIAHIRPLGYSLSESQLNPLKSAKTKQLTDEFLKQYGKLYDIGAGVEAEVPAIVPSRSIASMGKRAIKAASMGLVSPSSAKASRSLSISPSASLSISPKASKTIASVSKSLTPSYKSIFGYSPSYSSPMSSFSAQYQPPSPKTQYTPYKIKTPYASKTPRSSKSPSPYPYTSPYPSQQPYKPKSPSLFLPSKRSEGLDDIWKFSKTLRAWKVRNPMIGLADLFPSTPRKRRRGKK